MSFFSASFDEGVDVDGHHKNDRQETFLSALVKNKNPTSSRAGLFSGIAGQAP